VTKIIYLDNNASTALSPTVLSSMKDVENFVGNPSSPHRLGRAADEQVERARSQISEAVGASAREVVFTSGATEANNLALLGAWRAARRNNSGRRRIVVGSTEHPAILEPAAALAREGAEVVLLRVDAHGRIDLEHAAKAIDCRTLLVSVMAANNETGVLADIADIASLSRPLGVLVHSDATQAIGRIPVSLTDWDADMLSISGHKFHGPRGVGALIARREVDLEPLAYGGGQERGMRPGTANLPGIVGLGTAASEIPSLLDRAPAVAKLRDLLWCTLSDDLPGVSQNGSTTHRLPNTISIRFSGTDNEAILLGLDSVICSSGSACASGNPEPSHVLRRMGFSSDQAHESLRFSLSVVTTENEVRKAAVEIAGSVDYVRRALGGRQS